MRGLAVAAATIVALISVVVIATSERNAPQWSWMPKEYVISKLERAGYTQVMRLEADDVYWRGRGIKDGRTVEFRADLRSGAIVKEQFDDR